MFVLAHILSLSLFFLNVSASPRTEAQALVQWKESFSSSSLDSWSLSNFRNFCKWTGISCNSAGSVSRINLHDANITGTVALFSFSSFPDLTRLDISSNHFDGPLPSVGTRFSIITYLDLSAHTFEGGIPPEIGNLKELRYLSFYDNNLNGTIPYQPRMNYEEREARKKGYSLEEARSKMTECRKELRNRDSKGDSNEVDTTFSESMRYDVKLYYGGHFVQVPTYSYTSSQFKLYKNIDLENITVNGLKVFLGEIVGEFDSLYFGIDNGRLELLNNASKFEVIEYSRTYCSDEEFVQIKKKGKEDEQRLDELQNEKCNNEEGSDSKDSYYSEDENDLLNEYTSEESDDEICYATPPKSKREKRVDCKLFEFSYEIATYR
ncbi:hypothetical protein DCAR_0933805 [Daucus carota subsp. sativus]|uniref:Uncharacterized protein n=1 Tax=Daucus carota subsp. sativus TaxID=79200 RepID=A0A175YEU4_DAUCS|nr:hypothetical protein DCAR_0933805 [Daucus carota subsp. sativus]